jgi:cellulose synthase (UDP-forming)
MSVSYDDFRRVDRHDPSTRRIASAQHYSPVLIVLTVLATAGILVYAVFLLNPANRGDLMPWLMVVSAESVLVVHALLAMWTVLSGTRDPRDYRYFTAQSLLFDAREAAGHGVRHQPHRWPLRLQGERITVEVFVTAYGEPRETVRRTLRAALELRGEHRTWLLDDGRSDEMRALAEEMGCRYLRRLNNHGAKAGNVNHALTIAKGEYFCIFDADFVPHPDFLEHTMPFFVDETVAFVQTPQTYGNLHNMISRGAGYMQTVFYKYVQPGRNHFNAAFCVGTNVIFRRAAVHEIGGIHADSKSEDVWTSLRLHEHGWRSIYLAKTLAVGDAPDTVEAYTKQQLRWATGGFEIMIKANPFSPRRSLTPDQRIMYGITATHYLTGIAPGILLLVPPMEVFFDLHPVDLTVGFWQWLLVYAGFYVMQILLAFCTLGSFRWEVLMLAAVSFPIYVRALVNAVLGREQQWHVTGATTRASSPFNFMIPQVLMFVFLLLSSAVGIWQNWTHSTVTLGTAWNLTNTAVLGAFIAVAWREGHRVRRGLPVATRGEVVREHPAVAPAPATAGPVVPLSLAPTPQTRAAALADDAATTLVTRTGDNLTVRGPATVEHATAGQPRVPRPRRRKGAHR